MLVAVRANSPGWAVELIGEEIDLDDLREMLPAPFEPWIEDHSTKEGLKALLRSAHWAKLTETADVVRDATRIVERLNGEALLIHDNARLVKIGAPIKFGPDGKMEAILFAATGVAKKGSRARGRAATGQTGQPTQMQKWFVDAERDRNRAELFVHLSRTRQNDTWFDLYKSMELVQRLAGGEHKLEAALGADKKEWKKAKRTADCYRHAPGCKCLPPSPPTYADAEKFLLRVVRKFLA
jgi:hypothetical protein